MYRKIGRFETNYQIDLFCAVCVFILLHFVLLEKITFRFIGPPHFVLPDLNGINNLTASFFNDDRDENSFSSEIDYQNKVITVVFPYNYPRLSDQVLE